MAHVRSLLEEHGLECWGAVTLMMGARDLCHEDRYMRLGSVEYVKDCLTFVSELGGQIVTVVPSTVGKITPMGSPADEWRWCVEALRECQAHAETVGVRIGLEPLNRFETYFLNRCEQALALADAVGGDCGVALDTFHMNIEESDLIEAIHLAGDRLVDFHVADNNRMPPGHGALDWTAIVGALQTIGYEGHMTAEFVASLDRSAISDREIGDASEAGEWSAPTAPPGRPRRPGGPDLAATRRGRGGAGRDRRHPRRRARRGRQADARLAAPTG